MESSEMKPRLHELKPGDHFILGGGNFKKKLKAGDWIEDKPIRILSVWYTKPTSKDRFWIYPKRWWQFWIRKDRLLYQCEYFETKGEFYEREGES